MRSVIPIIKLSADRCELSLLDVMLLTAQTTDLYRRAFADLGPGGRSVGKGEVGGFPHLNAHFGQDVIVTAIPNSEYEHMKASVMTYYRKLMAVKNTSKGELVDRLTQAVAVLGFDGKASAQIANHGKNIEVLIDYLRRSTTSGGPAWSFDNAPDSVRYVLYHLPGSSVGRFMEGFLFNDWTIEESVKEFVRITDP